MKMIIQFRRDNREVNILEVEKSRKKCPRHLSQSSKGLNFSGAIMMEKDKQIGAILEINRKYVTIY